MWSELAFRLELHAPPRHARHGFRVHSFRGLLFVRDFFALSVESSFFRIPKLDFVIANLHTVGRVGHLPDAHAPPLGRAFAFLILFSLNSYRNSGDKQQTHVPALINHTNQLIC